MSEQRYQLRYRYAGGKLGKPIQIGYRTKWKSREEAEMVRDTLRFPHAIAILEVEQSKQGGAF